MNRILSRILVGCVAACAATSAWAGFTSQATIGETDWGKVLEDGCITQQGTHAELCRQEGLYKRINNIQNALEDELNEARAAETAGKEAE